MQNFHCGTQIQSSLYSHTEQLEHGGSTDQSANCTSPLADNASWASKHMLTTSKHCATVLAFSMPSHLTSVIQVTFENGYLAAHVDMLRHQHQYTSQILTSSAWVSTALNCRMQAPAADPRHLKKRPAAICASPIKPDPCDSFPGFCANKPGTPASPFSDFKALSFKQPARASGACLHKGKRYKQSIAHTQHHCLPP